MLRTKPRCPHCRRKDLPEGYRICPECVGPWWAKQREKKAKAMERKLQAARKNERKRDQQRKDALKSRSKWEDECRKIIQKIARIRDRHDGCISCHMGPDYDGVWHGSHYRSVGAASAVQFHLWNVHKACEQCNFFKGGNREGYRPRLIEKIGLDRVEWLDAQNNTFKPPMDYYPRFKKVMGKRLRRLEKRSQDN
jgi:hypothetical protein